MKLNRDNDGRKYDLQNLQMRGMQAVKAINFHESKAKNINLRLCSDSDRPKFRLVRLPVACR